MAPSTRRNPTILSFGLILLLVFCSRISAASAVLGIDLGTEYIKAVLVKPGIPLEIVLTKDSKRKEVSAVAFKPLQDVQSGSFPERVYGSDAIALAARFPGDVYPNLKPLLGVQAEGSAVVKEYKDRHPALQLTSQRSRGTVAFRSGALGKDHEPLTVEELLAMELQNVRSNAETMAGKGSSIRDVVITVPPFYTAEELRAVELAAGLAGLNTLGLITDGLAIGINYATSRTFPAAGSEAKPEHHLVFDMGAGYASATVLQFQGNMVKEGRNNRTIQEVNVLGGGWDQSLGGDALNGIIMDHMVEEFVKTPKAQKLGFTSESVKAHGRTAAKLLKEAERVRQVLSANSETFSSFEDLYGDVDFRYKLTRSQFEEMTSSFAQRVDIPLKAALNAANLKVDDLDSIILHGGATRTPFVQTRLEGFIGDSGKIRSNVNSDEAAVFGAAFRAAGLSPSFRVKEIRSKEGTPYPVGVKWSIEGKERRQKLFLPTSQRAMEKLVPLKALKDLSFTLYQEVSAIKNPSDIPVLQIQTHNLTSSVAYLTDKFGCASTNISTSFAFRLSQRNGLPEVLYGFVSCNVDSVEKKGMVDDLKGIFGFGAKSADQEVLKEKEPEKTNVSQVESQGSATTASDANAKTQATATDVKAANTEASEPMKRVERVYLDFSTTPKGAPPVPVSEINRMKDRLSAFDKSDKSRLLREESLNTLEAFIYRARDLVTDDDFISTSTKAEREELEAKLHEAGDWLYGDGVDADQDALRTRLKQLQDLVSPVERRKTEAIKRPEEIKLLKEALDQTNMLVKVIKEQIEKSEEESSASSHTTVGTATTDDFADLEDATSSSTTATSTETPAFELPKYTREDLESLTSAYESVDKWLTGKLAEQEKLSMHDDPILLSAEIGAKAKELNKAVVGLLQKQMQTPPKPKPSSKAKSKQAKTKASSKKNSPPSSTSSEKREESPTVVLPEQSDGKPIPTRDEL